MKPNLGKELSLPRDYFFLLADLVRRWPGELNETTYFPPKYCHTSRFQTVQPRCQFYSIYLIYCFLTFFYLFWLFYRVLLFVYYRRLCLVIALSPFLADIALFLHPFSIGLCRESVDHAETLRSEFQPFYYSLVAERFLRQARFPFRRSFVALRILNLLLVG